MERLCWLMLVDIVGHVSFCSRGASRRVMAEVKHNATNAVVCRVQGEWNGVLEFSYQNGDTRMVDVTKLPVTKKRVRPNDKQGPTESRLDKKSKFIFALICSDLLSCEVVA